MTNLVSFGSLDELKLKDSSQQEYKLEEAYCIHEDMQLPHGFLICDKNALISVSPDGVVANIAGTCYHSTHSQAIRLYH